MKKLLVTAIIGLCLIPAQAFALTKEEAAANLSSTLEGIKITPAQIQSMAVKIGCNGYPSPLYEVCSIVAIKIGDNTFFLLPRITGNTPQEKALSLWELYNQKLEEYPYLKRNTWQTEQVQNYIQQF